MPAQTAVVTGAAGGLGAAISDALERRGFEVVRADLRGTPHTLDVTDADACRALAEATRPAVWVNNAGVLGDADALEQDDAAIRRVVDVNLLGVVHGSRAAASVMRRSGGGKILNIGSMASWVAPAGLAAYAATKHGVRAYSVALAAELRGTGVQVSVLCPDGIWTPMLHDRVGTDTSAMSFIAGTLLLPEDVAVAALDLLDSGRLIGSLPRRVGVIARVLCVAPSLNVRLTPLMRRLGRRGQRTMAARAEARREEHV